MAPAGSHILPRESDSGSNGNLTTGAIAGIACGAGALFLGAGSLFLVYWRRQRRFDREDSLYEEALDERRPPGAMAPAVTYTLDYKMDDPHHHEGDHGSSYTYSPEKPSHPFSTLSVVETASAMPTHPAYIPRAFVRGSSTRGGSTPSNRSTATTSPPPFPSPPYPASWNSKTQPDDTMIQAYLNVAAAAQGSAAGSTSGTQNHENTPQESDSSLSGGLPVQPHPSRTRQSPTHIPAVVIPSFTSPLHSASSTDATSQSQRKPRAYLPPRLNLSGGGQQDKPLSGKENTTISGPLAFPQHYQGPPRGGSGWTREDGGDDDGDRDDAGAGTQSDGRRTFRSRALSGRNQGGGGGGDGRGEKGKERDKGKKHGRKRSDKRNSGGNRHYAEIEIGRDSDIW
ncbi:hypothetical protein C8A03DRAFT_29241 [Achaetomium macrosporum]|uniref:Uncharacterized protein n=1 Tax=Achaetomium macrosporum TaxID=79813 RepID=A0AAN7CKK3_9PEZI|nr:hypothetical protein C8A03DRAFT_29241 [Achaetomium macrosporum]